MLRGILYWGGVLIVSLAVVVALVYVLESRDNSAVGGAAPNATSPEQSPAESRGG